MMAARKRMTKSQRLRVYGKTGGHCAYCGEALRIEDMQIDHVEPLCAGGRDAPVNMLPACRSCNHRKGGSQLEEFRRGVEEAPQALQRDSAAYRAAVRFGLVEPRPRKIKFYFEGHGGGAGGKGPPNAPQRRCRAKADRGGSKSQGGLIGRKGHANDKRNDKREAERKAEAFSKGAPPEDAGGADPDKRAGGGGR